MKKKIVLIIGAIIVFLGALYFIKNTELAQKTPLSSFKQVSQDSNSQKTRVIKSGGYLIIPELGIKLKVGMELENLSYVFQENNSRGYEFRGVNFTSEELLAMDPNCGDGSLGSLGKTIHDPLNSNLPDVPAENDVKKIGEYYYYYFGPLATCSDEEKVYTLQTAQVELIKKAFQTIEPVN